MNKRPGGMSVGTGHTCRKQYHNRFSFPRRVDVKKITVANPKDVIEGAISNITALRDTAQGTYYDMRAGFFEVDESDVITSAVLPTSMVQDAMDSMREVKKIGAEVGEVKKLEHILKILNIVLMVLPFVTPGVGAAFGGAAMAARLALVIGEIAKVALGVEEIIHGRSEIVIF